MKVSELGESGSLERFLGVFEGSDELEVGPGEDDCAVIRLGDRLVAQSSDMFIDGVHFPEEATPWQMGWHSTVASVADVASTGARPLGITLSVSVPWDAEVEVLEGVARGANEAAREAGGCISGGDLGRSVLSIDCGVVGLIEGDPLLRSGAEEGQVLCVTGPLGGAAVGELVVKEGLEIQARNEALERLLEPPIRVEEGLAIAERGGGACTDLSDGLYRGMEALSEASGVGISCRLDDVPVHPLVEEVVEIGVGLEGLVDAGGDYELLFTAERSEAEGLGFPVIGEVGGDKVLIDGSSDLGGYDVFR